MTDELKYDPVKGASAIDRILLRGAAAHKSAEELSALTNGVVSPARAAQRVRDILADRDWLTDMEQRQLLWDDLSSVKDMLYAKAIDMRDTRSAEVLVKLLGTLNETLNANKFDLNKAMQEINQAHARLMLEAISIALERSLLELERRYPAIPTGELREIMQVALPDAVLAIEERVAKPE